MMQISRLLAVGLASVAAAVAPNGGSVAARRPSYRISPVDGSKIALPTKEQLDWQDIEIGTLIHFNIATYISIDGCNNVPSLVPNQTIFDPTLLNTDQWVSVIKELGAGYGTLVAKHNCGFTLWPSNVTFPVKGDSHHDYNYTIADSPVRGEDVVQKFSRSAEKANIGHGFYYSVVVNNFLNVQNSEVRKVAPAPGQVVISNSTYEQVVYDQLTELWTNYGNLTEIWFDGGYDSSESSKIQALLDKLQPQAVIFNGCTTDGDCISKNSVRWIGTEAGQAPEENWSTGVSNDGGDPTSPIFCPAECDTTLQTQDRWFFGVNQSLRSLAEMKQVYHQTVGRNCFLELDLTPDRSGLIPANYAARYKELGDFVRSCYGSPVGSTASHSINSNGMYSIVFEYPTPIDRIVLMEDQWDGQVIRTYNVQAKIVDAKDANGTLNVPWTLMSNGTSVGHKKIDLFSKAITVTEVKVECTAVDTPKWRSVTVHLC